MFGAPTMNRTRDNLITNQVLYQLSYKGKMLAERLGLEPRKRLSPLDGLAIRSNTIMGPFQLYHIETHYN